MQVSFFEDRNGVLTHKNNLWLITDNILHLKDRGAADMSSPGAKTEQGSLPG